MDNFFIEVQAQGKAQFKDAMELGFRTHKAIGYRIDATRGLVLYWVKCEGITELPYEMCAAEAIEFAWGWLQKQRPTEPKPDLDGDIENGFKVYTETWGQLRGEYQAFLAIKPIWALYGK